MPFLPILSGRAPANDHEIVLGAKTLHSIGTHIGDTVRVTAQNGAGDFHVVGTAVFPRFAPYPGSEPTGLGIGAATSAHAIETLKAGLGQPFFLVRAKSGAHPTADQLSDHLFHGDSRVGLRARAATTERRAQLRPSLRRRRCCSRVLLLLALGEHHPPFGHERGARRRDIAILKTIGFTARKPVVPSSCRPPSSSEPRVAFSIPLGIIMGRGLWIETADWLGIDSTLQHPRRSVDRDRGRGGRRREPDRPRTGDDRGPAPSCRARSRKRVADLTARRPQCQDEACRATRTTTGAGRSGS